MTYSHASRTIVAASFPNSDRAARALHRLRRAGLHSRVSVVAKDDSPQQMSVVKLPSRFAGSAAGAVSGCIIGLSLAGLSLMSGLPFTAEIALLGGAVAGLVAGSIIGATVGPASALQGMGLPESITRVTLPDLLDGHFLVFARVPRHRSDAARSALKEGRPTNLLTAA